MVTSLSFRVDSVIVDSLRDYIRSNVILGSDGRLLSIHSACYSILVSFLEQEGYDMSRFQSPVVSGVLFNEEEEKEK